MRFTTRQKVQIALFYWVGRLAIAAIGRTLRFEVRGWEEYERVRQQGPVVLSFWHNQIFSATYFWRHRDIVVMTSEHFDGESIARIIESFGYGTSRGSSTRGAVKALLGLKRRLASGKGDPSRPWYTSRDPNLRWTGRFPATAAATCQPGIPLH